MSNAAKQPRKTVTAINANSAIQLTAAQYKLYNKGEIELLAPNGELITCVGVALDRQQAEIETERLRGQLELLATLVLNTNGYLELNPEACMGLAETLSQAQQLIR